MCRRKMRFGAAGAILGVALLAAPIARAASAAASASATIVTSSFGIRISVADELHVAPLDVVVVPAGAGIDGIRQPGSLARGAGRPASYAAVYNLRVLANSESPQYTLMARLNGAPQPGTRWSINGHALSEATEILTFGTAYGGGEAFACEIEVVAGTQNVLENAFVLTVALN